MKAPFVLVGDSIKASIARIVPRHIPLMRENALLELKQVAEVVSRGSLSTLVSRETGNKWYGSELFLLEYVQELGAIVPEETVQLLIEKCPKSRCLPCWAKNPNILKSQLNHLAAWENFFRLNERMMRSPVWRNLANYATAAEQPLVERFCIDIIGRTIFELDRDHVARLVVGSHSWGQSCYAFFSRNHYLPGESGRYHDEILKIRHKKIRTIERAKYRALTLQTGVRRLNLPTPPISPRVNRRSAQFFIDYETLTWG